MVTQTKSNSLRISDQNPPFTVESFSRRSQLERVVAFVLAVNYAPLGQKEISRAAEIIQNLPGSRQMFGSLLLDPSVQENGLKSVLVGMVNAGILEPYGSMWHCSWSAHPIISQILRSSPEILSIMRTALVEVTQSAQLNKHKAFSEGMRRWSSLIDNSFEQDQKTASWIVVPSSNSNVEELFAPAQLIYRWFGVSLEDHFEKFPGSLVLKVAITAIDNGIEELISIKGWIDLLERFVTLHRNRLPEHERIILACVFFRAGYPHLIGTALGSLPDVWNAKKGGWGNLEGRTPQDLAGVVHFLRGDYSTSARYFAAALAMDRAILGESTFEPNDFGFLYLLALLQSDKPTALREIKKLACKKVSSEPIDNALNSISAMASAILGVEHRAAAQYRSRNTGSKRPMPLLLRWFCTLPLILDPDETKRQNMLSELVQLYHDAIQQENLLVTDWCARSLSCLGYKEDGKPVKESGYLATHGYCYPIVARDIPEIWETQCRELANLGTNATRKRRNENRRVAWVMNHDMMGYDWIVPVEQRLSETDGAWFNGNRFERAIPNDLVTEHDRRAIEAAGPSYTPVLRAGGAASLIGHPHVYIETRNGFVPTTFYRSKPRLIISRKPNGSFLVSLCPPLPDDRWNTTTALDLSNPYRIGICDILPSLGKISSILGRNGLEIPEGGRERLEDVIRNLSPLVPIEHDFATCADASPDSSSSGFPLTALLRPIEPTGLAVRFISRPDAVIGLEYAPGEGPSFINWQHNGEPVIIRRSLKDEKAQVERIIARCDEATNRALSDAISGKGNADDYAPCLRGQLPYSWSFSDPELSLKVIAALAELPHDCTMEWPVEQGIKVIGSITPRDFSLVVRKKGELFEVSGEVRINEALVEGFRELISRIDSSSAPFIKVDEKTFISISALLKAQLRRLKSLNASLVDEQIAIHGLTSDGLEQFLASQPLVNIDEEWSKHVNAMQELRAIEPKIPSGLVATLRPYQEKGVEWLLRMSTMGAGCCLADDMGLGKTVQALAAILHRAPEGPSLIVAPTSVCANWIAEAARFAPQLKISVLPLVLENRKAHIDALGPNDVLVISYGLIQRGDTTTLLAERHWAQVILDEAQAIKNSATVRTRSIREIPASWRLALSGTPIENRLEELWSIFHFLNPGLLGTTRWFQKRFLEPIEKNNDADATESLRAITSPFILRRLKSEVLTDLPPKETITVRVEMNEPEAALYEALRRKIADDLKTFAKQPQLTKENRLHVFAAMTQLRRLACNSALGTPPQQLPSAKLATCIEIIDELRANGHRALVFSQFIGHLEIVKEALTEKKIPHHYLDGSTPAAVRGKLVTSFQDGEGDIFLISLKAGGVGLNLTGADYVIHLDPWWNPAVLDQATDRAHRIGQQKPVTVYQLVSQGTIEEKIIERHEKKRALADSILDGADTSAQFSISELLDMIAVGNELLGRGEKEGKGGVKKGQVGVRVDGEAENTLDLGDIVGLEDDAKEWDRV